MVISAIIALNSLSIQNAAAAIQEMKITESTYTYAGPSTNKYSKVETLEKDSSAFIVSSKTVKNKNGTYSTWRKTKSGSWIHSRSLVSQAKWQKDREDSNELRRR